MSFPEAKKVWFIVKLCLQIY